MDSQQSDLPFHICVIKKFTVVSVVFVLGVATFKNIYFILGGGGVGGGGGIFSWKDILLPRTAWKNYQLSAMWFGYLLTLAYTALCVRGNCTEHNWACDK